MKKLSFLLIAIILTLCAACSNSAIENAGKELEDSLANAGDSDNKYVLMVKGGYREDNPDLTYDNAFSAFFGTPRWKYFKGDEGQDIVEFTGDCTYREVAVKARIQFVVDEEKGTFEAAYLAFNEVPQEALTLAALIGKVFEGEAAPTLEQTDEVIEEDLYSEEVLYDGVPLSRFFELSLEEVIDTLGSPVVHDEYKLIYDTIEFGLYGGEIATIESFHLNMFEKDGVTLETDRTELIALLGTPSNEGEGGSGYSVEFIQINYTLEIATGDYDGTAWRINIWRDIEDDGPSEEEWEMDQVFRRSDYFTGISRTDLLRYPDDYNYSNVYFVRYEVAFLYESGYFVAKRNSNSVIEHIVVDARNCGGPNPIVGDVITVYGVSWGITSISWTDGRSEQVPLLGADKLIVNNIAPNPDEFAQVFIESLNTAAGVYNTGNEYISGTKVRVICKLAGYSRNVVWPFNFQRGSLFVDGYAISGFVASYGGKKAPEYGFEESLPLDISDGELYWMTGDMQYSNSYGTESVSFTIESIEPYK